MGQGEIKIEVKVSSFFYPDKRMQKFRKLFAIIFLLNESKNASARCPHLLFDWYNGLC